MPSRRIDVIFCNQGLYVEALVAIAEGLILSFWLTQQQTGFRVNKAISGGRTKTEKRKMKVSEARPLLEEGESERLINQDTVCSLSPPLCPLALSPPCPLLGSVDPFLHTASLLPLLHPITALLMASVRPPLTPCLPPPGLC